MNVWNALWWLYPLGLRGAQSIEYLWAHRGVFRLVSIPLHELDELDATPDSFDEMKRLCWAGTAGAGPGRTKLFGGRQRRRV